MDEGGPKKKKKPFAGEARGPCQRGFTESHREPDAATLLFVKARAAVSLQRMAEFLVTSLFGFFHTANLQSLMVNG